MKRIAMKHIIQKSGKGIILIGFVVFSVLPLWAHTGEAPVNSTFFKKRNALPVTGVVTNNKGEPVEGATVTVKGQKKSVITDKEGKFSIDANPGDVLIITSIGY